MQPANVTRRTFVVAALLATLPAAAAFQAEPVARQVAAPAADLVSGRLRLPDPAASATRSRAAIVPIEARASPQGWRFEARLPVARAGPLSLALLSPEAATWRLRVQAADGQALELERAFGADAVERRTQVLASDLPGWVVARVDLAEVPDGAFTWVVDAPDGAPAPPREGWLIAADALPLQLSTHVTTHELVSDAQVGIAARLVASGEPAREAPGEVLMAWADVHTSSGSRRLDLLDDGQHADGAAGDGLYGGLLPRWTSGDVRARVELAGVTTEGHAFRRSAQLAFPVLERRLLLSGSATTTVQDDLRLGIELSAWPLGPRERLQVSAEVWGTDEAGALVPVCWLSRMQRPLERADGWGLALALDARWLAVAEARPPLELRAVRVQDPDTHVVLDHTARLPLRVDALPPLDLGAPQPITSEMLAATAGFGQAFDAGAHGAGAHTVPGRGLMLVHGYCSGGSIWPPADFTQPKAEFLDPNANRTHDQFAQLLAQQGGVFDSFGVVAHSQGGAAALHLLTYYQSPLDKSAGGRRIQSLATPYQGTPLASLGSFACGVNNDMTPSGAAAWLAGIPTWARQEVWYWTTSDAGSACNFLTSLFLSDPEDGTVEQVRGQLPGASSMGHVTGWCHTTGMSYPASYTDHARNAQMDAAAAR